jgi:hypothetical protein
LFSKRLLCVSGRSIDTGYLICQIMTNTCVNKTTITVLLPPALPYVEIVWRAQNGKLPLSPSRKVALSMRERQFSAERPRNENFCHLILLMSSSREAFQEFDICLCGISFFFSLSKSEDFLPPQKCQVCPGHRSNWVKIKGEPPILSSEKRGPPALSSRLI